MLTRDEKYIIKYIHTREGIFGQRTRTLNMKKEQEIENEKTNDTEVTEATEQIDDITFEELNSEGDSRSEERRRDPKLASEGSQNSSDDITFETTDEEGEISLKDTIKKLRTKIKELEKESKENLDGWTRAKADYVNFTKEVESRRKDDIIRANKNLIIDLLPVLDAYDMARANEEAWQKVDTNWRIGVEYIFNQLLSIFEREGIEQIGNVGETFDPQLHDSIETVPTEKKENENKIAQVLQKGYIMNGLMLRGARVKVWQN